MNNFDVIVIGGGHAGVEAALASSRLGASTLLMTMKVDGIGYMPCNPAIGGQAKGQLAREIDALGGEMGINTDKSAIQYKRLNSSKGPAVRSSRAQCDKEIYSRNMKQTVFRQENLSVLEQEVVGIEVRNRKFESIKVKDGSVFRAKTAIVTAGTFLKAIMHCGENKMIGGRAEDSAAIQLSDSLSSLGFSLVRLKTGTPARLKRDSIDFSVMEPQYGDEVPQPFSYYHIPKPFPALPQVPCFIAYTNKQTHEVIEKARDRSPMFTGSITGRGPRYCPSIEDKVFRFADKDRHHIFLEPESLSSDWIYANGLSTSLPAEDQDLFLRTIVGLENVAIARYGYAVEYDALNPQVLKHSLECKDVNGLYFAGQVNGTSGYEEAAAQGLMAGINAYRKTRDLPEFILGRDEAYIGVLIDDLVTKGVDEPYRMFTSRAEYRLLLREDNSDERLAEKGYQIGLLTAEKYSVFQQKQRDKSVLRKKLNSSFIRNKKDVPQETREKLGIENLHDRISLYDLIKRPGIDIMTLLECGLFDSDTFFTDLACAEEFRAAVLENVEVEIKYEGYIFREKTKIEKMHKWNRKPIPGAFDFRKVNGLSNEVREKLHLARPETIDQALRIPGVTPAACALLLVHLEKAL